jgi:hypothetical protein
VPELRRRGVGQRLVLAVRPALAHGVVGDAARAVAEQREAGAVTVDFVIQLFLTTGAWFFAIGSTIALVRMLLS